MRALWPDRAADSGRRAGYKSQGDCLKKSPRYFSGLEEVFIVIASTPAAARRQGAAADKLQAQAATDPPPRGCSEVAIKIVNFSGWVRLQSAMAMLKHQQCDNLPCILMEWFCDLHWHGSEPPVRRAGRACAAACVASEGVTQYRCPAGNHKAGKHLLVRRCRCAGVAGWCATAARSARPQHGCSTRLSARSTRRSDPMGFQCQPQLGYVIRLRST